MLATSQTPSTPQSSTPTGTPTGTPTRTSPASTESLSTLHTSARALMARLQRVVGDLSADVATALKNMPSSTPPRNQL
jgi:hypothetical protein